MLAAMFTLPVAGTALNLADQHLHPRNMATALILLAVDRIPRQQSHRGPLLLLALSCPPHHGGVRNLVLLLPRACVVRTRILPGYRAASFAAPESSALLAALPLSWIFEPPTPTWRRALDTRTYYFLYQWTWYEWLGAIGPLVLFWLLWRYARKRRETLLARFALALVLYGAFSNRSLPMILLAPPALIRLTPLQPMRYLHLVYLFLALIAGCLLGRACLGRSMWRWAVFLVAINGGMFLSQRLMFPSTEHLEFPGRASANPWLQAFAWIRQNTPADAYFALDPELPGRTLARTTTASAPWPSAASSPTPSRTRPWSPRFPQLAPRWAERGRCPGRLETASSSADFERLKGSSASTGFWFPIRRPPV